MALIRRFVVLVLVSALAAGCSPQSLFIDPDDDGDGNPDDPDGGVILDDGGNVIPPDADPDAPDAGPTSCPAPCLYDAVRDFAYAPDAISGQWLYAEETPNALRTSYSEMRLETRNDGTQAYVSGLSSAAFVHCPSHPDYSGCAGVEDKLLFETTEPEATDPALVWLPPDSARTTYRMSGDWRVPAGGPIDAPVQMLLVRNSQFDSALDERFLTRSLPTVFDFEMDVRPGDILRLIAIGDDDARAPVAVSFYISSTESDSTCQIMTRFETGSSALQFTNLCASQQFQDNGNGDDACPNPAPLCPATTEVLSPGVPGKARGFVEGASMQYLGPPNDYSGDFTVQFWAYFDSEGSWTTETVLADHDCETERGIRVMRDSDDDGLASELAVHGYYPDPEFDRCPLGPQVTLTTSVTNDAWHFIRITRSTGSNTMALCVDGVYSGHRDVPAGADLSATQPMWLGRAVTYEPAYFRGRLADLRVFEAALPCRIP